MPKGYDYSYGAGAGGGLGNKHGQIGSPLDPCPYSIEPNGGNSDKGGEKVYRFGEFTETQNEMMGVNRDSLQGNLSAQGGIETPMDESNSMMPGLTGSSGYGSISGGGAKIASPFVSPWGDKIGSK